MSEWPGEKRKELVEEKPDTCRCPGVSTCDASPWGNRDMEPRDSHSSPASAEQGSSRAEDSDFLPSVRLAAVLLLIFALVSSLLLYSSASQASIAHSRRVVRSSRVIQHDYRLEKLRLLFPTQTEKTWWTLERSLSKQWLTEKSSDGISVPFVAFAQGSSRNTLLCLAKTIVSLLSATEQVQFPVARSQLVSSSPIHSCWGQSCTSEWPALSVAVVGLKKGCVPYGIHVGVYCSHDGGSSLLQTTLSLRPAVDHPVDHWIHNVTSDIASELLGGIDRSGGVPGMVLSMPVLQVYPEHYLESGFVC
ncbi:uncharacterized protein [Ambystoma mexicanum]|uniref:uncharacterized protein n=1 Tax=Ambystoma mexicanum TaxID=8296 RepID=UPI0037E7F9A7